MNLFNQKNIFYDSAYMKKQLATSTSGT